MCNQINKTMLDAQLNLTNIQMCEERLTLSLLRHKMLSFSYKHSIAFPKVTVSLLRCLNKQQHKNRKKKAYYCFQIHPDKSLASHKLSPVQE